MSSQWFLDVRWIVVTVGGGIRFLLLGMISFMWDL